MKYISIALISLSILLSGYAINGGFEGKVKFSIKVEGQNAQMIQAMMPTAYNYHFRGKDMRFIMEGGMMSSLMGDILVDSKKDVTYIIQHSSQSIFELPTEDVQEGEDAIPASKPKVTPLNETETILGYKCKKYEVVIVSQGAESVSHVWSTTDLDIDIEKAESGRFGGNMFFEGVPGFPLKMVATSNQGGLTLTFTNEAISIEEQKLSDEYFKLPASYTKRAFDPKMFSIGGN